MDEASEKFQKTVEQLQKVQNDNKSKADSSHSAILQQMEGKFN